MKRFLLGVAVAWIALPAVGLAQAELLPAEAKEAARLQSMGGIRTESALAAPVVRTIAGTPLTVYVADDMSFQVLNSNVPGSGQFYPSGSTCTPADFGLFARVGSTLFAPNFNEHPCGTATGALGATTDWTPVSISAVTGTGTSGDPFTVVVVADAVPTALRATMTVTYINGEGLFRTSTAFSSTDGTVTFDAFLGGDIFLANNDDGIPFRDTTNNGVGGRDCVGQTYTVLLIPTTPADSFSANDYSTVWSQIGAGSLPNTVATGCIDNGSALQWRTRTTGSTIQAAVSFLGVVGVTPTPTISGPPAIVPTLSFPMMALFGVALAGIAFILMRRH